MTVNSSQLESLVADGAKRLIARSGGDSYGVNTALLEPRMRAAVEKYLLRDNPEVQPQQIASFFDTLQSDDLCLIVACENGDERAWTDLVERFSATVRSAARTASSNEATAEDLAQSIWAELHGLRVRDDGRPSGKLAYYSGRGSLAGWLRAVVAQLAIDQHRKQSRLVQTEEDAEFDRLIDHDGDGARILPGSVNPEVATARKFATDEMQKALAQSIQQLDAEDRLLVKLYYFDNLRLREAGAVLGVHEATASRRLTRIHTDLRSRVERILINEKGWTETETHRAFSELVPHLDTDIEPLLSESGRLTKRGSEIAG